MFDGYMRFGGIEVWNTERLQAYVDNGLVPVGTTVTAHGACEGLGEVVDGPTALAYRTPIYDQPPWYDQDNPDTWDFAGVLPLEVTGLDGSTAVVEVSETLGGGGQAGRRTWKPRTVAVSALLVGRTTESVVAGLAWLTTALHRTCVDDDTCGSTAALQGYTVCPGPLCTTADLDALPHVDTLTPGSPLWWVRAGDYDTITGGLRPVTSLSNVIDGDTPATSAPIPGSDSGDYDDVQTEVVGDGGPDLPNDVVADGVLGAAQYPALAGPVTLRWTLSRLDGPAVARLVLLDEVGNELESGATVTLTPSPTVTTWTMPYGVDYRLWRPAIVTDDADGVRVTQLEVESKPQLSTEQCAAPYLRTLPRATVVAGPTVVEVVANGDCADFLRVEWTWVVGSPYRFGTSEPLALDLGPAATTPTYVAPGVSSVLRTLTGDDRAAYTCYPALPEPSCFQDPCAPGFTPAPSLPVIVDPSRVTADTTTYNGGTTALRDLAICLDTSAVPSNDNVLTISLRNDNRPKLGVRVRVYDTVEPDCLEESPCDFAYEYQIDYIPAGGTLTIDGVAGTVTTFCQGVIQDSSSAVAGTYGGALADPVVRCDQRYLIHVQWLDVYPRSCSTFGPTIVYTAGDLQGDLAVDLAVTAREG